MRKQSFETGVMETEDNQRRLSQMVHWFGNSQLRNYNPGAAAKQAILVAGHAAMTGTFKLAFGNTPVKIGGLPQTIPHPFSQQKDHAGHVEYATGNPHNQTCPLLVIFGNAGAGE